ncbi:ADP-ribose pyrophosphatase [Haloferula luteola]|uniref:GDP-mannose pyrophosphatase n=1 Tax=Haloferula luteola TaxID=595692 RepID=A0A840V6Q6_9BACT|nr:NUDIX hydrolase [Haloferula luteola]MBB5353705.1 ADP-ribose pyrophosphatase [Haloferula luteola]
MIETLYESRWLGVYRNGHWDFVRRPNSDAAVGVLAVTSDAKVLLVEQFRIPMQKRVIEIPAGLVGDEEEFRGEDLSETARRELIEETGYQAESMVPLMSSPTSAGMTCETTHLFLASGLTRVGPGGGTGSEDITVHEVPLVEMRSFLRAKENQGCLVDFKIQAALWEAGL